MKTTKFDDLELQLNNQEEYAACEKQYKKRTEKLKSDKYLYVKDADGYVTKIPAKDFNDSYTVITENEWAELSGEKYYRETFTHGGARKNSGRKKLNRTESIRLTLEEKELIICIRNNFINPEQLLNKISTMAN